jgi:zinc transport system substrate-binding protein/iron/zinc/copper transport system substrate-binding protein
MKKIILVFAAAMSAVTVFAQSGAARDTSPVGRVVASTSWTAAIARAAGAPDVSVIAPMDLKHPPEYELKPSDLAAVEGAALVVHSGYEKFAKRLAETSSGAGTEVLVLYTDNLPPVFKREARKVAEKLGTVARFEAWEKEFDSQLEKMRSRIGAAYPDKRAVVHKYLATYAEWMGFQVVGTFGPGELSPAVLIDLVKAKPALIIDNWHNIAGKGVAESLPGASYVELINFPGKEGTVTIEDVFAYNEWNFLNAAPRP